MSWPSPADYQEAIQYPKLCFADPELKAGTPLTDRWGMPRPISGAFASVYQVSWQGQKHAVRCFLRDVPDIDKRYALIGDYLSRTRLPFVVEFKYLPQGIRVRGDWYPILKMDWVEGERLDTYIGKHLNNPQALADLARKFLLLAQILERASIAHGDLQHGNILVVNGMLKLIDYDGMYVPALAGFKSNELGQPNYQHPDRTEKDFGPYLDHFSEWVIYLTLVALAVDPGLRLRFAAGSECLLLGREDYSHPEASALLKQLTREPDGTVREMAARVASFSYAQDLTQIPSLGEMPVMLPAPVPAPLPGWVAEQVKAQEERAKQAWARQARNQPGQIPPPPPLPRSKTSGNDAWVRDHVKVSRYVIWPGYSSAPGGVRGARYVPSTPAPGYAQALAATLPPLAPLRFSTSPRFERVLLAFGLVCLSLITWGAALGILAPAELALALTGLAGFTLGGLFLRYQVLPETRERNTRLSQLRDLKQDLIREERRLRHLSLTVDGLETRKRQTIERLTARLNESSQQELQAAGRIQHRLKMQLDELRRRRRLQDQAAADELRRAIVHWQDRALTGLLRQYYISTANMPGISAPVCQGLVEHGIWTAADIADVQVWPAASGAATPTVYVQVPRRGAVNVSGIRGMSETEARRILAWRRAIEQELRGQLPQSLPLRQEAWLKARHQVQLRLMEHQVERAMQLATESEREVHARYRAERAALARQLVEGPGRLEARRVELTRQVAEKKREVANRQSERDQREHELEAYREVNLREYLRRIW